MTYDEIQQKLRDNLVPILGALLLFVAGTLITLLVMWNRLDVKLDGLNTHIDDQHKLLSQERAMDNALLNERMTGLKETIDRWSARLPALAESRLTQPISMAVIVSKPRAVSPSQFTTWVHVLDLTSHVDARYEVQAATAEETQQRLATTLEQRKALATSFTELASFETVTGKSGRIPEGIDPTASFILTEADKGLPGVLQTSLRARLVGREKLQPTLTTWNDVIAEVRSRPERYEAPAQH